MCKSSKTTDSIWDIAGSAPVLRSTVPPTENPVAVIEPMHYGLAEVMQLAPVARSTSRGRRLSLDAASVAAVVPEAVEKREQAFSIRGSQLLPVLVKAIQDQQRIIEELVRSYDAQQGQIAALRRQADQVEVNVGNERPVIPTAPRSWFAAA